MCFLSNSLIKIGFLCILILSFSFVFAQEEAEFIRNRQQQEKLQQQFEQSVNVHLDPKIDNHSSLSQSLAILENEVPCTVVNRIVSSDNYFNFAVNLAIKRSGFHSGMCLGSTSLEHIQKLTQNILIEKGFITSQVQILPQNISSGKLVLSFIHGIVESFEFIENKGDNASKGRVSVFQNKFPVLKNDLLNLRNLEQGLENLRRLPSVETDIRKLILFFAPPISICGDIIKFRRYKWLKLKMVKNHFCERIPKKGWNKSTRT